MLFQILVIVLCSLALLNMWILSSLMRRRPLPIKGSFVMLPACAIACMAEVIQLGSTNYDAKVAFYTLSTILFIVIFMSFCHGAHAHCEPLQIGNIRPISLCTCNCLCDSYHGSMVASFNGLDVVINNPDMSGSLLTVSPSMIGFYG